MRTVKDPIERKNEILDAATILFSTKGYDKCTVNDILEAVGIAKGTFYYYFKSKEDVLDAIVEKVSGMVTDRAREAAAQPGIPPDRKLLHIFLSMRVEQEVGEGITQELHKPNNALLHQKSLQSMIWGLTPILVDAVEEGNRQGVFNCEYPVQYMQIFLTSAVTLLDEGIFQTDTQDQASMLRALLALLEKMLGLPADTVWDMAKDYFYP